MKIAIIGAGEFQLPLVQKAREMGIETHVFAWEQGAVAKEHADYFYPISIIETDSIYQQLLVVKPDAVLSICSEVAMPTVASLCERLGLIGNSVKCAAQTLNKFQMKTRFIEHGIPCANGRVLDSYDHNYMSTLALQDGVIVKPIDRSGSLAVELIYNLEKAKAAVEKAIHSSFEKKCVVEEYIGGQEYSVETVSYRGEHRIVAITKKTTTGSPYFVERMHSQPAALTADQSAQIESMIPKALSALEISHGISHAELKIDQYGRCKFIEIGGRMGGDYIGTHLVKMSTGVDLIEVAIQISLGKFNWNYLSTAIHPPQPATVAFVCHSEANPATIRSAEKEALPYTIIEQSLKCGPGDKIEITNSSCKRKGHIIFKGPEVTAPQVNRHFGIDIK